MRIRVNLSPDSRRATVHCTPNWFERLFAVKERDFEVWRIRDPYGLGVWIEHDNRPVTRRVAVAIEAELRKQAAWERLKARRGGRR
jgi:hypothetical protein